MTKHKLRVLYHATIALGKRWWYVMPPVKAEWDYPELNRVEPVCYFYTGKRH